MANVQGFCGQTDRYTKRIRLPCAYNNYMPPIYRCEGIKINMTMQYKKRKS